jgi:FkbM family methyltransferase
MSNNFLEKIFSVKNENIHKIVCIFGIKFKFKRKGLPFRVFCELKEKLDTHLLLNEDIMYLYPSDSWWKKENFEFFKDREKLQNKYLNLIRGMDIESIDTISRVISRIQEYVLEGKTHFLLTEKEKAERRLCRLFLEEKIELANGNYARRGYILPQEKMEFSVFVYKHGLNAIRFPERFKNKEIIDVGAYIGDSALVFSDLTNNHVHAFEPVKDLYDKMIETINLNSKTNIIPKCIALGAEEKTEIMRRDGICSAIDSCLINAQGEDIVEDIPVSTLDKYVAENNLQVGLIKVDIEGYEQEFLKGAMETIKSQRPTLIMSIYHNSSDFFDIKPLIENLNLGYKFRVFKGFDYSIFVDTVLICEVEE